MTDIPRVRECYFKFVTHAAVPGIIISFIEEALVMMLSVAAKTRNTWYASYLLCYVRGILPPYPTQLNPRMRAKDSVS